ncbi:ROK family protein [Pollutibacter soli]|uniref:ROK family protein n=1 Tax=Pollutibacter soli TaxID=3034157 RepID=UPI0030140A7C
MKTAIGIDLGGTRIKAVAVDESGRILKEMYTPTADDDTRGWRVAVKNAHTSILASLNNPESITGISAPGLPNATNSCISVMPGRLQGLENFEWASYLSTRAWVLNDANSALAAELKFGVAAGKKNVILLTLGTGVGGSIAIDGRIYQGAFQKAGHLGHMSVDADGLPDICGMPGSLEDAIGNCTIGLRTRGRYHSTQQLLDGYRLGEPLAAEVWLRSIKKLAVGIASLTNILSPEMVILGGGITSAGDALFKPLADYMDAYEWRTNGNRTSVVKAHFGDLAGAVGAAGFALLKAEEQMK